MAAAGAVADDGFGYGAGTSAGTSIGAGADAGAGVSVGVCAENLHKHSDLSSGPGSFVKDLARE